MPRWATLNDLERKAYRVTVAFLRTRLEDAATVEWALQAGKHDRVKQAALLDLLDGLEGTKIGEPWHTIWRLIEESWKAPPTDDRSLSQTYRIAERIKKGERSGNIIADITDLVKPRLKIAMASNARVRKRSGQTRSVDEVCFISLTSSKVQNPHDLGLNRIEEPTFLVELAHALSAAITYALDTSRRLGWENHQSWRMGQLRRVYYVPKNQRAEDESEPDEYLSGIAPSVKLLFFVVSRLVDLDTPLAVTFVRQWKQSSAEVFTRLWAAMSRDKRITDASDVAAFLSLISDKLFWDQNRAPEIAEARALRFAEFSTEDQNATLQRLRKLPPRTLWPKGAEKDQINSARKFWLARELRRIELAGGILPSREDKWLKMSLNDFPDLAQMSNVHDGFMGGPFVRWIAPNPDTKYNDLVGLERLRALEAALSSSRRGWDDDPAGRASQWIGQAENQHKLLEDIESLDDGGATFRNVWNRFGWDHSPTGQDDAGKLRDRSMAQRVLLQVVKLPDEVLSEIIEGLSNWLSRWQAQLLTLEKGEVVWRRVWPIAVTATNATNLETVASSPNGQQPMDLDTLNTPAGKLVGVFLERCPRIKPNEMPFSSDNFLREMRDTIVIAPGRSGLIVKHRLIEHLPYFLLADPSWTKQYLIPPLMSEQDDALPLWRAVARKLHFKEGLEFIGGVMVRRANDARLDRETRQSLIFSLVVECLHSFYDDRSPAVQYAQIQQLIRSIEDEVRSHAAGTIQQYVRDMSSSKRSPLPTPEGVFERAAKPFLRQVWPQERSLSTPGVSKALADLPATARNAFADAVNVIERFLVPFECWSMIDYGLYGDEMGEPKLANINDPEKAEAFLRLLHLTIGDAETSVIPTDLADALDQVRQVAPHLAESPYFRRLATAARRV